MDAGVNMQNNEEKRAEKSMDDYLKSLGLHRKKIAKDGSCLFRAVAEQVLHCQSLHTEVRAQCVEFLKRNRDVYEAFIEGDFEAYLCKLQDPQQWVGEVEINALAVMYKRDFLIYQEPGKPAVPITDNDFKDKVQLCFLNGNHYDSVYPTRHIKSAAMCQSILYELLYERVFKVDRNMLAGLGQRGSRLLYALSDDSLPTCVSSDESELDSSDTLRAEKDTTSARHKGRGRGRLSESLRRSLNPTLYRNVEYNVWEKSKKAQQKLDYCIAAGMQYTVGDRCLVRLESGGRSYSATVKEVPPNDNYVMVFIEDLGLKQVPLWTLRPFNEEVSWSTVANRDKKLNNGHGDGEQRCKGRGRGKPPPASSSVAQATTPGSGGRVQKQHSVEEQGGTKSSRTSGSTADSVLFGLTEEQRLAREEEERNVALVEIQLRDEHSFPALGVQSVMQGDGGKRKGGEKKRSQRQSTKSPMESFRAAPPAGERPTSSTPPPASAAAAASADSQPNAHVAPAAPGSTPRPPLASAAPAAKASAPSYASAAGAPPCSPPPAAAPDTKPAGGAAPSSASVFSIVTPILPAASSTSSSSGLHPKTTASPPSSSAVPPPTFIAPIAPSPVAAQSFLASGSFPRSSPSFSTLPHSHSPPAFSPLTVQNPSSSPVIRHAVQVQEAPAQTPDSLPHAEAPLTAPQTFQSSPAQIQPQAYHNQISVSQPQAPLPQAETPAQMEVQGSSGSQAQSALSQHTPQAQSALSQHTPQAQAEFAHVQTSQRPPEASHPNVPQGSVPSSAHVQSPVSQPPLPPQLIQAPHPSLVPHPSPSLSIGLTHPSLQTETPDTPDKMEAPPPAVQNPQAEPPAHPLSQQPQPPHPLLPPQSIPGTVPLQQLSQLYQDPLYPGFPQEENGTMVTPPPFSSSKSGEDLPKDVNILRFFFNLGIKAYTLPMFPPWIYLTPLQQAYALHPKLPSRSPSPTPQIPPSSSPVKQQEAYPQYPLNPASAPAQYDHQAPVPEPHRPSEPPFNQATYPIAQPPPQRMPWQQQQQQMPPPSNSSYPVAYPSTTPPYPVTLPPSQGYPSGQDPGHPAMPPPMPPYPPSSLGYHQASTPDEFQVTKATVAHHSPANGDTMPGHGLGRVHGSLEGPAAANVAKANNRPMVAHANSFGFKKEQEESVLLVDPPLNNIPIHVNMMTMTTSGIPGPHDITSKPLVPVDINPSCVYRGHRKPYLRAGAAEPSQVHCLPPIAMSEGLSVACSTEDDLEEEVFNPSGTHYRMPRRSYRGRGRGGHDGWRGGQRRTGFNHSPYGPSYVGQSWARGYQP